MAQNGVRGGRQDLGGLPELPRAGGRVGAGGGNARQKRVEERFRGQDLGSQRLGTVGREIGVGVVAVRQGEVLHVRTPREKEREGLVGRCEARRVAVVRDDDRARVAGEKVGLLRRQGRPHRGDRVHEPRPLARDAVEVALDEEDRVLAADRLARAVEAVEELALREARGLRGVEVLGLFVAEGARSEAEDLAARVADLDREAVAEPVVDASRLGVLLEEPRVEECVVREARRESRS